MVIENRSFNGDCMRNERLTHLQSLSDDVEGLFVERVMHLIQSTSNLH